MKPLRIEKGLKNYPGLLILQMALMSALHCKNSPWPVIIKLIPASERLVDEIPAGDGKIGNLFYSVSYYRKKAGTGLAGCIASVQSEQCDQPSAETSSSHRTDLSNR
jgi:hypothetical protein